MGRRPVLGLDASSVNIWIGNHTDDDDDDDDDDHDDDDDESRDMQTKCHFQTVFILIERDIKTVFYFILSYFTILISSYVRNAKHVTFCMKGFGTTHKFSYSHAFFQIFDCLQKYLL